MSNPRQRAISGIKWTSFSQAGRIGAQLLSVVVLARLLSVDDFGIVAMATVATGFAALFRDLGTAAALIQKETLSLPLLDSVFRLNVCFGIVLALILALLAPLVAEGFAEPRLTVVLWLLALSFPIYSLGAVHQALLERASRFRGLAILEWIAVIGGVAAAIVAAILGWGVYSLVLQVLVSAALVTTILWRVSTWRPGRCWDWSEVRGLVGFSGNLVGFNIFNYLARNADSMLIGRFLGSTDLGYYSMAYKLMLWPLQNISNVVGRAMYPVLSRMQHDRDSLGNAYLRMAAAITLITAPIMFLLFVLRESFVGVAVGPQWYPISDLLLWLAPIGLLQSVGTTVGLLYLATGRTDLMLRWGIFAGSVVVAAIAAGLQWGLTGVAVCYALTTAALFLPSVIIPLQLVHVSLWRFLGKLGPSLFAAGAMAIVVVIVDQALEPMIPGATTRLFVVGSVGIGVYAALIYFMQRTMIRDIRSAIGGR